MTDIPDLLRRLPQSDEMIEAARRIMDDYRGFCLARPTKVHVEY